MIVYDFLVFLSEEKVEDACCVLNAVYCIKIKSLNGTKETTLKEKEIKITSSKSLQFFYHKASALPRLEVSLYTNNLIFSLIT